MTSLVWLVTGASRGLGAEIVRAALASGDRVVAGVRSVDGCDLAEHDQLRLVALDVTRPDDAEAAVATAVSEFGRLDVVVNNAGRHMRGAVEEITDQESRDVFDVNFFGVLHMIRAALPVLREQRSGRIITIGSASGLFGRAGSGLYSATKFAVSGLTEALADEVAGFGVFATIVEPGGFRTDFLDASSMHTAAEPLQAYVDSPAGASHLSRLAAANHQQPGDPVKAAETIVAVAHAEKPPVHLLLGADAIAAWEQHKVPQLQADIDAWRDRSVATAFDEV